MPRLLINLRGARYCAPLDLSLKTLDKRQALKITADVQEDNNGERWSPGFCAYYSCLIGMVRRRAVIIDSGSRWIRIGIAGSHVPLCIMDATSSTDKLRTFVRSLLPPPQVVGEQAVVDRDEAVVLVIHAFENPLSVIMRWEKILSTKCHLTYAESAIAIAGGLNSCVVVDLGQKYTRVHAVLYGKRIDLIDCEIGISMAPACEDESDMRTHEMICQVLERVPVDGRLAVARGGVVAAGGRAYLGREAMNRLLLQTRVLLAARGLRSVADTLCARPAPFPRNLLAWIGASVESSMLH